MSRRLAEALAEKVRRMGGASKFIAMEGVSSDFAAALVESWKGGNSLPRIAVVGADAGQVGDAALPPEMTPTTLRGQYPQGFFLVQVEGHRIDDSASVGKLVRLRLADLVSTSDGYSLLTQVDPEPPADGPARAVRDALTTSLVERPPPPERVAAYLDAIAAGQDPLDALPRLGAFADRVQAETVDANRIAANLRLANARRTDAVLSGSNLAAVRQRAYRLFDEKYPDNKTQASEAVATLIEQLRTADDAILSSLSFDEARTILEGPRQQDLSTQVVTEIEAWVREKERRREEADAAVSEAGGMIEVALRDLGRQSERREAARRLVEFHLGAEPRVFSDETLKRLNSLLKEPRITVSRPEEGIVRAVLAMGGIPSEVVLREPRPPEDLERPSDQRRALSLLCARLRLARLLTELDDRGCLIPAALLEALSEEDIELLRLSAPERGFAKLDTVQIVVRGGSRSEEWRFGWRPDIEDLAILNALFTFASEPALAFRTSRPSVSGLAGRFDGDALPVSAKLYPLAEECRKTATTILRRGYDAAAFRRWAKEWHEAVAQSESSDESRDHLDALALAGTVHDHDREHVLLTPLAPMKAEWLADRAEAWDWLLKAALGEADLREDDEREPPIAEAAEALASLRAAGYPPSIATSDRDDALLAADEGEVISVFGSLEQGAVRLGDERGVVGHAFAKFIDLHPESSTDFRCVAWGEAAPDAALGAIVDLLGGSGFGGKSTQTIRQAELICVGGKPSELMLEEVDDLASEDLGGRLSLRYGDSLDDLRRELGGSPNEALAHVSVVIGLTKSGRELTQEHPEVETLPTGEPDALWGPRVWVRPDQLRRTLLAPPRTTEVGDRWFRLMSAIGDRWPSDGTIRIPELRTDAKSIRSDLQLLHDLGSWVVTVDRYAGRDALENALGNDVAILHQERRLASDNIQSLVISQKSGRSTDRAIARSLRDSQLVADDASAIRLAEAARRTAADWNGILALRAATTGSGVNELLGQVMAYRLLASMASPWPFPPGHRVLLIGLDEYQNWFGRGKRADLLALSLDTEERGVHCAAIEVKAVRSTDTVAAFREAKEQLRATIADGRFAVSPDKSLFSRMWLNRIAEAAIGVARESNFRLQVDELDAIEEFRTNRALEWAGVGLIFGHSLPRQEQHPRLEIMGDKVPVSMYSFPIEETLDYVWEAGAPGELRSEVVDHPMPESTKKRRPRGENGGAADEDVGGQEPTEAPVEEAPEEESIAEEAGDAEEAEEHTEPIAVFEPPILGRDVVTGEAVYWRISGEGALSAGHMEIYGTTGAGKTQFIKSVLKQLHSASTHFSICDFKNDYEDADFPQKIGATFYDLWDVGAPFNPLAIPSGQNTEREIERRVIELGDEMGTAAQTYPGMRLGHRQLGKLKDALHATYAAVKAEGRQPTLLDLNDQLDDDLRGIIGDLTRARIFTDGPPFSTIINTDAIFGLQKIPGIGFTTDLAAGFILSGIAQTILEQPQVANLVKYMVVIDEAHRVSGFKAVSTMLREGRSKGLAVVLATQQPGDLPPEAEANAQTKVCFRLPSGPTAAAASRLLGATDRSFAERIQALENGEAFVRFAGLPPRVVRVRQFWRDDE